MMSCTRLQTVRVHTQDFTKSPYKKVFQKVMIQLNHRVGLSYYYSFLNSLFVPALRCLLSLPIMFINNSQGTMTFKSGKFLHWPRTQHVGISELWNFVSHSTSPGIFEEIMGHAEIEKNSCTLTFETHLTLIAIIL